MLEPLNILGCVAWGKNFADRFKVVNDLTTREEGYLVLGRKPKVIKGNDISKRIRSQKKAQRKKLTGPLLALKMETVTSQRMLGACGSWKDRDTYS